LARSGAADAGDGPINAISGTLTLILIGVAAAMFPAWAALVVVALTAFPHLIALTI
jgi:hypothetical protein